MKFSTRSTAGPPAPDDNAEADRGEASGMTALRAWLITSATFLAVFAIGALVTPDAWYSTLLKPTWQPPSWLFGPVWATLYVLLAIGLALLLQASASVERTHALRWYFAYLLLNVSWSPLFFGAHSPGWAFLNICVQWLVLALSILASFRVGKWVGWLQFPTLLWVTFALVLNGVIVALNL